jgi:hypothetical protein
VKARDLIAGKRREMLDHPPAGRQFEVLFRRSTDSSAAPAVPSVVPFERDYAPKTQSLSPFLHRWRIKASLPENDRATRWAEISSSSAAGRAYDKPDDTWAPI